MYYPINPRRPRPDVRYLDPNYFLGIKGAGGRWLVPPGHWHTGVDFNHPDGGDSDLGQPVHAIEAGTVVFAGLLPGRSWGNGVVIQHGNYYARYMHLRDVRVSVGQRVEAGQRIGTVGKGYNNAYTAHLHFDVMVKRPPRRKDGTTDWGYWPGTDLAAVKEYFTDPVAFFAANKMQEPPAWRRT